VSRFFDGSSTAPHGTTSMSILRENPQREAVSGGAELYMAVQNRILEIQPSDQETKVL
jgi:hypothetical protein